MAYQLISLVIAWSHRGTGVDDHISSWISEMLCLSIYGQHMWLSPWSSCNRHIPYACFCWLVLVDAKSHRLLLVWSVLVWNLHNSWHVWFLFHWKSHYHLRFNGGFWLLIFLLARAIWFSLGIWWGVCLGSFWDAVGAILVLVHKLLALSTCLLDSY